MSEVDMGEFMKFCHDFNINVPRNKIQEIYKKSSKNNKPLKFDHFMTALQKLAFYLSSNRFLENDTKLKNL